MSLSELPSSTLYLAALALLAGIAVLGYLVSRARNGRRDFTLMDAMILGLATAIVGAAAVPLLEAATRQARRSALFQNLHTLRSQIELYKAEHGGNPPLLFKGAFPQLTEATDADGKPGAPDAKHHYGPYVRSGVPPNPITGTSVVTDTETFPPSAARGNGGWLYHQQTGQIAIDLPEFLLD